jgi:hypothetical protein
VAPFSQVVVIEGDEIPLYLANIVIAERSPLSVASIDDLVATVFALLKSVPDVVVLELDIFVNTSVDPPRKV